MNRAQIDDPIMPPEDASHSLASQNVLDEYARKMSLILLTMTPLLPLAGWITYAKYPQNLPIHLGLLGLVAVLAAFRDRLDGKQIAAVTVFVLMTITITAMLSWGSRTPLVLLVGVSLVILAIFFGRRQTMVWGSAIFLVTDAVLLHYALDQVNGDFSAIQHDVWAAMFSWLGLGLFGLVLCVQILSPIVSSLEAANLSEQRMRQRKWLMERSIQDATASLEEILDNALVGITVLDEKGDITAWNAVNERFLGVTAEQMLGQSLQDFLFRIDEQHPLLPKIEDIYQGRAFYNLLLEAPTANGVVNLLMSGRPIFDQSGRVRGGITIGAEVTSLLRQLGDIGISSASEEATAAADDIRSPLMSLGLSMEALDVLLDVEQPDLDRIRAKMPLILKQQAHAAEVVESYYDNLRTRSARKGPHRVDYVTESAVAVLRASAEAQGIAIDIDVSLADGAQINAQSVLVRQVLINLLTNARDAIEGHRQQHAGVPESGTIWVMVESGASTVTWIIEDNGGGTLGEDPELLFQQGYTNKPVGEGSGMGLFIGRATAEHLAGSLTVSQGEDGLCFSLTLPRSDENA